MSNVHNIKPLEQVEDEAAAWVWRLDDEACSQETKDAFQAWLKEDPRHRKVYESLTETWGALDDLEVLKHQFKLDTILDGVKADEREKRWFRPQRLMQIGTMAAVVALSIVGITYFYPQDSAPVPRLVEAAPPDYSAYATAVGEQRVVTLEDGSTVELNTDTIIEVAYSSDARLIRLEQGEAHFTVETDTARPFIVDAGDTGVRAVGTAFNVHRVQGAPVEVIVTEGEVDLIVAAPEAGIVASFAERPIETYSNPPEEAPDNENGQTQLVRLTAGQSFNAVAVSTTMIEPQQIEAVSETKIEQELSWRRGWLSFQGESLEDVVEELSRYTEARFIIVDDEIRARRVGGRYKTDDIDGLLSVLEQGLDVSVRREGEAEIYLSDAEED